MHMDTCELYDRSSYVHRRVGADFFCSLRMWVEPNMEGRVLQGHEWKGGGGESWRLAAANQNTAHVEEVPRKGDIGQRVVGDEEMVVMENSGDENV